LPQEELLRHALPSLARILSQPENWTPLATFRAHFEENQDADPDRDDPGQFRKFLFRA